MGKFKEALLVITLAVLINGTQAQRNISVVKVSHIFKPVYLSGHIDSDDDSAKIRVLFYRDVIKRSVSAEPTEVHLDKNGNFLIALPGIDHIARIDLLDMRTDLLFCDNGYQLVEPGDSIHLDGVIRDKGDIHEFSGICSGKGAAKFNCLQELKKVNVDYLYKRGIKKEDLAKVGDSLLNLEYNTLEKYKGQLNTEVYELMKLDLAGNISDNIARILSKNRVLFEEYNNGIKKKITNWNDVVLSNSYTDYLYYISQKELYFDLNKGKIEFKDFYYKIKNEFSGEIRDKLLTYCCLDNTSLFSPYFGMDPDEFLFFLNDAIKSVNAPWLKESLVHALKTRGKGAAAFNFTLPADSTEGKVSLSDFKGKVVLLDIWGYQCTGCSLFTQIFHNKVYPIFKDNPSFTVISIMGDESSRKGYMRRLRGTYDPDFPAYSIYTYPEYINLFAGRGEEMGTLMRNYYQFNAYPAIMLIDKQGKIYSSTIPILENPESPDVKKLIDLITKALSD